MPITSRSSLRSATICWRSIALRTLVSRSRQPGGPLELELVGRLPHRGLEPLDDRVGVALEELEELVDQLVVALLVDLADARARALLDVEQQARPAELLVALELVVGAGAHRERAQQQVEGLADRVGVGVGPEVADALAPRAPHHPRPGPLVVDRDGEERVALVVDQPDVEPRPVLLDEGVLEHERLDVVADLDPLDGLGGRHHLGGAGRQVRPGSSWSGGCAATSPCRRRSPGRGRP